MTTVAASLTGATRQSILPERVCTAAMTASVPWPRASGANRRTSQTDAGSARGRSAQGPKGPRVSRPAAAPAHASAARNPRVPSPTQTPAPAPSKAHLEVLMSSAVCSAYQRFSSASRGGGAGARPRRRIDRRSRVAGAQGPAGVAVLPHAFLKVAAGDDSGEPSAGVARQEIVAEPPPAWRSTPPVLRAGRQNGDRRNRPPQGRDLAHVQRDQGGEGPLALRGQRDADATAVVGVGPPRTRPARSQRSIRPTALWCRTWSFSARSATMGGCPLRCG